jgi:hypothetical protein
MDRVDMPTTKPLPYFWSLLENTSTHMSNALELLDSSCWFLRIGIGFKLQPHIDPKTTHGLKARLGTLDTTINFLGHDLAITVIWSLFLLRSFCLDSNVMCLKDV